MIITLIAELKKGIRNDYYFPSMHEQAQSYVDNCLICFVVNTSVNTKEGELQLKETLKLPMYTVHIDHFGSLIESTSGRKHVLVNRFIYRIYLASPSKDFKFTRNN